MVPLWVELVDYWRELLGLLFPFGQRACNRSGCDDRSDTSADNLRSESFDHFCESMLGTIAHQH